MHNNGFARGDNDRNIARNELETPLPKETQGNGEIRDHQPTESPGTESDQCGQYPENSAARSTSPFSSPESCNPPPPALMTIPVPPGAEAALANFDFDLWGGFTGFGVQVFRTPVGNSALTTQTT
ncbi:hypothetical protein BKA93DRAFT_104637 [Sparassis latifolia]